MIWLAKPHSTALRKVPHCVKLSTETSRGTGLISDAAVPAVRGLHWVAFDDMLEVAASPVLKLGRLSIGGLAESNPKTASTRSWSTAESTNDRQVRRALLEQDRNPCGPTATQATQR